LQIDEIVLKDQKKGCGCSQNPGRRQSACGRRFSLN